jgi:putative lipoprotein
MKTTIGLTLIVALAACGGADREGPASGDGAAADTLSPGTPSGPAGLLTGANGPVRVAGHMVFGRDRRDFQPCQGGAEYWVDGPALPDLLELHDALTPGVEPFEAVFVDVLAEVDEPPATGAGTALAGTLDVLEVRRVAWEGGSCDATAPDLVVEARGNEPFWVLEVREGGVGFATPEGEWTWQAAGPPARSPEGWRASGTTDAGEPYALTLALGGCQDSMSGAWSHLSATLVAGGREWTGCAWLGPAGEV